MDVLRANRRRFFQLLFLICIFIILAIIPGYVAVYYVSLLVSIFKYIVLTVSWATFCGPTGYISLASAAFLGTGMYVTALMGEKVPLPLVILFGGLASFLLALLVGLASLRIRGIFFAIFTLGLSEGLRHFINWWEISRVGRMGRWVISAPNITIFYTMLIILVMTLLTSYLIRRSKFGLALRSIGDEEEAAKHIGINVNAVKLIIFAITSFWMGATGAIIVTQWLYVDTPTAFNVFYSFEPTLMALFGGIGQIYGWVLGSVLFTIITELLLTEFPYYYMLIFGSVIISVFLFFPSGLVGVVQKWWKGGGMA
jgi:branched-chain amino acid transport system permease protein